MPFAIACTVAFEAALVRAGLIAADASIFQRSRVPTFWPARHGAQLRVGRAFHLASQSIASTHTASAMQAQNTA